MIQIGKHPIIATAQSHSTDTNGKMVGHYHIIYTSQYLSFKAYCDLALQADASIEIHY